MSRAETLKTVARAAAKAIAKSVALSLVVLGPGFVMLLMGMTIPGMIWLFCGSFGLMAWTYRKPWRLGVISCLAPPAAAAACYALQLFLFGDASPPGPFLIGAIAAGLAVGYWRAQTHRVSRAEDGGVIAERTIEYLLVWVAAYAITQMLGLLSLGVFAVRAGLVTGAFSTAMLAVVSIVLWRQFKIAQAAVVVLVAFAALVAPDRSQANEATLKLMRTIAGTSGAPDRLMRAVPSDLGVAVREYRRLPADAPLDGAQFNFTFARPQTFDHTITVVIIMGRPKSSGAASYINSLRDSTMQAASCGRGQSFIKIGNNGATISLSGEVGDKVLLVQVSEELHTQFKHGGSVLQGVARAACNLYADQGDATAPTRTRPTPSTGTNNSTGANTNTNRNTGTGTGTGTGSGTEPELAITAEDAAAVGAAVATILIAAGVAVNVAQAIAAAIANALQAGVQLTSEEIQSAIADALLNRSGEAQREPNDLSPGPGVEVDPDSAPPNVPQKERFRPPTPIYQPDGTAFETNDDGEYLVPGKDGRMVWVPKARAEAVAANLWAADRSPQGNNDTAGSDASGEPESGRQETGREDRPEESTETERSGQPNEGRKPDAGPQQQTPPTSGMADTDRPAQDEPEVTRRETEDPQSEPVAPESEQPPARPGFMETIWNRAAAGLDSVKTELGAAGADIWKDPWILLDTGAHSLADLATARGQVERAASDLGQSIGEAIAESGKDAGQAVVDDLAAMGRDPRILGERMAATGNAIRSGAIALGNGLSNVASGTAQAGRDLYENPELFGDTLYGMGQDIAEKGRSAQEIITNPDNVIGAANALAGGSHFRNAIDPNRTLPERLAQVGMGVGTLYGTATGLQAAGQGLRNGASSLLGKVSGSGTSLVDDGARLAAGSLDDAGKAGAKVAGASDETSAAAQALGQTDEGAAALAAEKEAAAKRRQLAEMRERLARERQAAGAPRQETIDEMRDRLARQPKGPSVSPEDAMARQDYGNHLQNRTRGQHSTIRPGGPEDLAPAPGVVPDTAGYTTASERHAQQVADKYGARIYTRPTNHYARDLLDDGAALSKREYVKNKSTNPLDVLLSDGKLKNTDLGKVSNFEPKLPTRDPGWSDDYWNALNRRHAQRSQEFKDQAAGILKNSDKLRQEGALLVDVETGLPFTGDVDGFTIRGMNNETLPKAVVDQMQNELKRGPGSFEHNFHTEWDYSGLSRAAGAGGAQSKFDVARGIDSTIRDSHAVGGEALNVYAARSGRASMAPPAPGTAYWAGGTNNPLVQNP